MEQTKVCTSLPQIGQKQCDSLSLNFIAGLDNVEVTPYTEEQYEHIGNLITCLVGEESFNQLDPRLGLLVGVVDVLDGRPLLLRRLPARLRLHPLVELLDQLLQPPLLPLHLHHRIAQLVLGHDVPIPLLLVLLLLLVPSEVTSPILLSQSQLIQPGG